MNIAPSRKACYLPIFPDGRPVRPRLPLPPPLFKRQISAHRWRRGSAGRWRREPGARLSRLSLLCRPAGRLLEFEQTTGLLTPGPSTTLTDVTASHFVIEGGHAST